MPGPTLDVQAAVGVDAVICLVVASVIATLIVTIRTPPIAEATVRFALWGPRARVTHTI